MASFTTSEGTPVMVAPADVTALYMHGKDTRTMLTSSNAITINHPIDKVAHRLDAAMNKQSASAA